MFSTLLHLMTISLTCSATALAITLCPRPGHAEPVTVAIIDTGADLSHPALRTHLWTNPGESGQDSQGRDKSRNQIDDDGNGFIDDVHGWNFADRRANPVDRNGHGTHIAGIIASQAPASRLMILKYYDPNADERTSMQNTIDAIRYAVKMGARIINFSAGGPSPNRRELEAIRVAGEAGVLFVAAAGNEASNSDRRPYYPADYRLPNILSVTAIDRKKRFLASSNFGLETVHVAAPGEEILSALPQGRLGSMTGTSQATAYSSGVAARYLQSLPSSQKLSLWQDPEKVIRHLIASGESNSQLKGRTRARTVINSERALLIRTEGQDVEGVVTANSAAFDPRLFSVDFESTH